jgi:hypothetical protein
MNARRSIEKSRGTRPPAGFLLLEMVVYLGVFAMIVGFAYAVLYRCINNSTGLRHSAEDIALALETGERWREDIRLAGDPPRVETTGDEQVLHLGGRSGETVYRFSTNGVFRRLPGADWTPLLKNVKSTGIFRDADVHVTAWRWELELQPRTKRISRTRPLFTFIAVAQTAARP